MHISFTNPDSSGKNIYDNTGSCGSLSNYLINEHDLNNQYFFNHERNDISEEELSRMIDYNVKGLKKDEEKFISLYVSPSFDENKLISENELKNYVIHVVQEYAQEYNLKKNIDLKDLVWGGVVHKYRYFKGFESKVSIEVEKFKKQGLDIDKIKLLYKKKNSAVSEKYIEYFYNNGFVRAGEKKPGNNMHAHILVSARDKEQKVTLNPNRAKYVKFSKSNFYYKSIKYFSDHFKYPKSINDFIDTTHNYLNSKIRRESSLLYSKYGIVIDESKLKINLKDIQEKDFYVKSLNNLRKTLGKQKIENPEKYINYQYNIILERYKKSRNIDENILNDKSLKELRDKSERYIYFLNKLYHLNLDDKLLLTYSDSFDDKRLLNALSSLHNRIKNDIYFPVKYDINDYVLDIADSYKSNLKYLEYNSNFKIHKLSSFCYYLNNTYTNLNLKEDIILKLAQKNNYDGKVFYSLVSLGQSLKNGEIIKDPKQFLILKISENKSDVIFINYLQHFNKKHGLNITPSLFLNTIKADTETGYFILRDFNYKIEKKMLSAEFFNDPKQLFRESIKQYNYYLGIKDNIDLRFLTHPSVFYHWKHKEQLKYLGGVINSINNVNLSENKKFNLNEIIPFYSFKMHDVYKSLYSINHWFKDNKLLEDNFKDVLLDHVNYTINRNTYLSWDNNKREQWLNGYLNLLEYDPKMKNIIINNRDLIKKNAKKYSHYINIYRTMYRVKNLAYEESVKVDKADYDPVKNKPVNWKEYINKTFERTYFEEMAYDYSIKYKNLPNQSKVIRMDAAIDLLNDRFYLNITGAKINKEYFIEMEKENNYSGRLNSAISSLTYKLSNSLPMESETYNDYILKHMSKPKYEKSLANNSSINKSLFKPLITILDVISNNPILYSLEKDLKYNKTINEDHIIPRRVINRVKRKLRNG